MGCKPIKFRTGKKTQFADENSTGIPASELKERTESPSISISSTEKAEIELVKELVLYASEHHQEESVSRIRRTLLILPPGHGTLSSIVASSKYGSPEGSVGYGGPAQNKRSNVTLQRVAIAAGKSFEMSFDMLQGADIPLMEERRVLTPRDRVTIRQTWQDWADLRPGHAVTLCIVFFKMYLRAPSTRQKFPFLESSPEATAEMENVCRECHMRHIMDTLSIAVDHLDNPQCVSHVIRKIGARHKEYGLTNDRYTECYVMGLLYAVTKLAENTHAETLKAWLWFLNGIKSDFDLGWRRMMVMDMLPDVSSGTESRSLCGKSQTTNSRIDFVIESRV
ncbi:uncharacterized protein [Littorina saxatilis]|uniref:Globin n=1 Tax=Littorina saxatilis TaxID=31220 RepID=A0AAN9BSX3_9CAEN